MSKVKIVVLRVGNEYSEIFVDGKTCGKVSDYGDEYSASATNIIERLIDKLNIDNIEVIEERVK